MEFETEEELRKFILNTGCFDKKENERIYENFFRGSIERNKRLLSYIEFEGKEILDVDCAYGSWLVHFPKGSLGVEIQPRMTQFVGSLGLRVISANVDEHIPVENSMFDIVHCRDLLEHVIAPHKVLREFYRILRHDGELVIGVPNMDSPLHSGWKHSTHINSYNKKSLTFLLDRSGFKVSRAFVLGPRLPKVANFLIYEKVLPGRIGNINVVAHKITGFKYPKKRLDIYTPFWMK